MFHFQSNPLLIDGMLVIINIATQCVERTGFAQLICRASFVINLLDITKCAVSQLSLSCHSKKSIYCLNCLVFFEGLSDEPEFSFPD